MKGFPPERDTRVTLANWQDPPFNRWSFSHLRELVPTQPIRNHSLPHVPDEAIADELDHMLVGRMDGSQTSFADLLDHTFTDAVVVIQDDRIRYERYFGESSQHRPHLLMSVTKSLVGCVAGNLIEQGLLSPEDPLTKFVPELSGGGYTGATVRNVLDMRSGVKFSEEYTDPDAEVRIMEQAFGWRPASHTQVPQSIYEYTATLSQDNQHGGVFDYRSCETLVLGWVLERAAQTRMADLISDLLWTPMGGQFSAEMTCDSVGTAIHDGGVCATARDVARFGEVLLHRGHIDGVEIVPAGWLRASWRVDPDIRDAFARSKSGPYLPGGWYRNQFWFLPRRHGDVLLCLGIYGQMLYVNPGTKTVAAKLSTWPDAQAPVLLSETIGAFDTLGAHLAGLPTDIASAHEGPPGIASGRAH
jgi:CubicO group peptidase (beta-lactamase class C family)